MSALLTVGYGNREPEELLRLLLGNHCQYLIDVRSSPYSQFYAVYNKESLEAICKSAGFQYVFMGDQLGGRPQSGECYDAMGHVDYERLSQESYFKYGIKRLKTAIEKNLNVVLLCSELNPEHCHRCKLIGQALVKANIAVQHIDADGSIVPHDVVIGRILGGEQDLFGSYPQLTRSRGSYQKKDPHD